VSQISNRQMLADPKQNNIGVYMVSVALPEGLATNYGKTLEFKFETKGIAEIVTVDRRLLQRLFDNLKYRAKI
jgi:hypothetical protein